MIRYLLLFMCLWVLVHANVRHTRAQRAYHIVNGSVECFYCLRPLSEVDVIVLEHICRSNPDVTNSNGHFTLHIYGKQPGESFSVQLGCRNYTDNGLYSNSGVVLAHDPDHFYRLVMVPNADSLCVFYPEWNQEVLEEEQSRWALQLDTLPYSQAEERFKLQRLLATNAAKQAQNQKVKGIAHELLALGLPKGMLLPEADTIYRLALCDFALGKPLATLDRLATQVMPSIQSPTLAGAKYMLAARAHMVTLNFDTALVYYDSAVVADTSREDYTFEYGLVLMAKERLAEAGELFKHVAGHTEDAGLLLASKMYTSELYRNISESTPRPTIVTGRVTQQNSGNAPVVGAAIYAEGANPITTDSEGHFRLEFFNRKASDYIKLAVAYQDWEVVNDVVLHTTIPAQDNRTPLRIFMCPGGELEANALAYYKINEGVIQEAYRDTLAALNAIVASNWQEQKRLDSIKFILWEQVQAAFDWAWEVSEKFAQTELGNSQALYQQAYSHFTKGELYEAQALLGLEVYGRLHDVREEEKRLTGLQVELNERQVLVNSKSQQYADAALLKARLHVNKLQFAKAHEAYQWAAQFNPSDQAIKAELAQFMKYQLDTVHHLDYDDYQVILSEWQGARATPVNQLGFELRSQKAYDSALLAYQIATIQGGAHSEAGSLTHNYTYDMATTLTNLGYFYSASPTIDSIRLYGYTADGSDSLWGIDPPYYAMALGLTAWDKLVQGSFYEAGVDAKIGLGIDNSQVWILITLAHSYLLRGRIGDALQIYDLLKAEVYNGNKTIGDIILEDLATLEATGITHPGMAIARALLMATELRISQEGK